MNSLRLLPRWALRPGLRRRGFSLVELLVVMAIIGVLAAIGLPRLRGFTKGNAMNAAVRQVMDDLSLARLKALNNRSRVIVVFLPQLPQGYLQGFRDAGLTNALRTLGNVFESQCAAYAILTERSLGDQPGHSTPRYVTEWRRLPEGVVFLPGPLTNAIDPALGQTAWDRDRASFERFQGSRGLPFPLSGVFPGEGRASAIQPLLLPCVVFNPTGSLGDLVDRDIVLLRGSVFTIRDASGFPSRVDITHPKVSDNTDPRLNYELTQVRLSGLTGRASIDPLELP